MKRGVVLLSGGLDSTTCLAIATRRDGLEAHCLSFDYGQRHRQEIEHAATVAAALGAASHRVARMDLSEVSRSALLDRTIEVPKDREPGRIGDDLPSTYVPARNTIFLAVALGMAETLGAEAIYLGVNALDYSGYPDCRPAFVKAFADLARAACEDRAPRIESPLLYLTKAEIIRLGSSLGVDYSITHSCYDPSAEGWACGRCDACLLRSRGFAEAGVPDPTRYTLGEAGRA
ncbi:Queuosine Biosynthesis QueC ATPase [Vulgatibacter incomptus]|uniref:7-cyano-7-deazaguanine synthase n=1 Tax=Vulgatibacter incomptus TaxID=1391653 RepID=A0A0K1PF64_9BACT|nr:7-cyano-7-deazaguanine synthase QueC [Vulgatibacter incomptus]AKU92160.1 Queuosine Biosynthesis QueC ATPase [Vulgatibacter incomptus]